MNISPILFGLAISGAALGGAFIVGICAAARDPLPPPDILPEQPPGDSPDGPARAEFLKLVGAASKFSHYAGQPWTDDKYNASAAYNEARWQFELASHHDGDDSQP